jgi:hypothetical protein
MMQLATTRFARWLVGLFLIVATMPAAPRFADAHGIAGNRFFPGTLSFDDPAVADESILPLFTSSKRPDEGGDVVDNRFSWSLFRLLTPTLGVGVDSGWVHRNWAAPSGQDSMSRISRSKEQSTATICTRRWWPPG